MADATVTEVGQAAPTTDEIAAPPRNTEAGTKDKKGKKERVKKVPFRGDDDPKLTEWPENFDKKLHKPLRRGDFANELVWLERKYAESVDRAKNLKKEIEDFRTYGDPKIRKQAQKAEAMALQAAEMIKQLKESGIDVSSMQASLDSLFKAPAQA